MADKDKFSSILSLLWAGNTADAKEAIDKEMETLIGRKRSLSTALAAVESDLADLKLMMPPGTTTTSEHKPTPAPMQGKVTAANKRQRKIEIIRAAQELSKENPEFTTMDIAQVLADKGVDMHVPANRVSTAIGITLSHCEEFESIATGVYRTKKKRPYSLSRQS